MRTTLYIAAALCAVTACDRDKEKEAEKATAAPTSDASAQAAPAPKPKPEPKPAPDVSPADAVQYLPQDCMARGYLDIQSLRKYPKAATQLTQIFGQMLSRNARTKETLQLMSSTLESGGLKLPDDVHGLAACVQAKDQWITVATLDVGEVETGPLALIQKTVNASGGASFSPKEKGKLRYLSADGAAGVLSFIDDGVLAVANDPKMLEQAAGKPGKADAFGKKLEGMLVAGQFSPVPDSKVKLYLEERGDAIGATLDAALTEEQAAKALKDRDKFIDGLKKGLAEQLGKAEAEDLKALAAKFEKASISIEKDRVRVSVDISEENVTGLINALVEATPDRLGKEVDQLLP